MIAPLASPGLCHAAIGTGSCSFSAPLRTMMPASADITDLVAEKPSSGVSMPTPSA